MHIKRSVLKIKIFITLADLWKSMNIRIHLIREDLSGERNPTPSDYMLLIFPSLKLKFQIFSLQRQIWRRKKMRKKRKTAKRSSGLGRERHQVGH